MICEMTYFFFILIRLLKLLFVRIIRVYEQKMNTFDLRTSFIFNRFTAEDALCDHFNQTKSDNLKRMIINRCIYRCTCGLLICEFAYSHLKHWSKRQNFQSECVFLPANSVFEVQNSGTYLPGITRPTCIYFVMFCKCND